MPPTNERTKWLTECIAVVVGCLVGWVYNIGCNIIVRGRRPTRPTYYILRSRQVLVVGTTVLGNQRRPKTMMTWLDLAACRFVTMDDRLDTKQSGWVYNRNGWMDEPKSSRSVLLYYSIGTNYWTCSMLYGRGNMLLTFTFWGRVREYFASQVGPCKF